MQTIQNRARSIVAASVWALGVAGCQATDVLQPPPDAAVPATTATVEEPAELKYFPSDEPLRRGIEHFNRGNYGLTERYFRDAAERAPRDATAWIGLAASYDRLARFDLADRAYHSAIRLTGESTQILNNEGYSYMLRGDLRRARAKFLAASRREPDNPTIANNLALLDGGSKYIERPQPRTSRADPE